MTKLTDLTPQELADLLDWPLDRARKWLEVAVIDSKEVEDSWVDDHYFGEFEARPSLQRKHVRELMHLSVEDVEREKREGKFYRRYPYLKSRIPRDTETRLKYLRELLRGEVEFETRYPVAYRLLYGASTNVGLPLPSFDVRVLKNNPRESVWRHHWFGNWEVGQYSGDAYSLAFLAESEVGPPWTWDKEADQSLTPPDLGSMRGLLLTVLSREESAERLDAELHNEAMREEVGAPAQASVRLTDLRLALARELEDKSALEKALAPLLDCLERPITTNNVLQWKWDGLFEDEEERGRRSREEEREAKIKRVSFAAAALLLFLDFDMPGLEGASSLRLASQIADLADIIRKVSKSLNANARSLERLLAFRDPNRPRTPGQELYDALVDYRMGKRPSRIAEDLVHDQATFSARDRCS